MDAGWTEGTERVQEETEHDAPELAPFLPASYPPPRFSSLSRVLP